MARITHLRRKEDASVLPTARLPALIRAVRGVHMAQVARQRQTARHLVTSTLSGAISSPGIQQFHRRAPEVAFVAGGQYKVVFDGDRGDRGVGEVDGVAGSLGSGYDAGVGFG